MNKINLPPLDLIRLFSGSTSEECYLNIGKSFCDTFVDKKLFSANSKILDAGCGCGRMARFFVDMLDESIGGEYHGFDVSSKAITWCSQNISSIYNNFNFKHIDLKNQYYNPSGSITSVEDVIFDYKENYFDFIFATSLFTHMQKKETEKYLRDMHKVAKPGGKLLLTFFKYPESIEDFASAAAKVGHCAPDHKYFQDSDVSYIAHKSNPKALVIYQLDFLKKLFADTGFKIVEIPDANWQAGIMLEKN